MKPLFFSLFFICGIQISQSQILTGKVINADSRAPVEFASVQFIDIHTGTATDEKGYFTYNGILPQNCKIKISALGYESAIKIFDSKKSDTLLIELHEAHMELNEVTISASTGTLQKYSIANVESRSINELNNIQSTNLGEALSNIPGVYQVSTGNGISKPVIRGLSGMRVVTYLNGLRIENQQWGGDHGMGITENGIGNVEIIKGPASLLYGADALGGVLYYADENYARQNHIESYVESQFESNSLRTKDFAALKISGKNLRANIFGNYSNTADYRLPNGRFAKNTRYFENNIKGAIGYNKNKWVLNIRYNYLNNNVGIPGETEDSLITPESFQASLQQRNLITPFQFIRNHYTLVENAFYFNESELKIWLGNTFNRLGEYEEDVAIPEMEVKLRNYTYNILWRKKIKEKTNIIIGSQGMFQQNANNTMAPEALIPDSRIIDNGAYTVFQTEIKKWEFETGLRVDNRLLESLQFFNDNVPIRKSYTGINYSLGTSRVYEHFMYRANISTGYRPPHLSELLSNGIHHGSLRYEVGNKELKSEMAVQADAAIEYISDHLSIILNPFYNSISNYIYLSPYDSIIDGFPLYYYQQEENTYLYGGDLGFHYHPHFAHRFHMENSVSYVRAEDGSGTPLPLIPQTRINSSLRYEFKNNKKVCLENLSLQHLYFLEQNRVVIYESISPSYMIFNLGANIKFNFGSPVYLKLGIKNIFNEVYIDHLSRLKNIGLVSSGRNFYASLKINLSRSTNKLSEK